VGVGGCGAACLIPGVRLVGVGGCGALLPHVLPRRPCPQPRVRAVRLRTDAGAARREVVVQVLVQGEAVALRQLPTALCLVAGDALRLGVRVWGGGGDGVRAIIASFYTNGRLRLRLRPAGTSGRVFGSRVIRIGALQVTWAKPLDSD